MTASEAPLAGVRVDRRVRREPVRKAYKMLFERIVCAVAGHKYVVQRVFSATSRQVGCTRCGREWGMNDSVRSFIPWDGELEQFYRDIGQWPGQTPNA